MQTFGQASSNNSGEKGQGKVIQCGAHSINVVRASSLQLGTYQVRFYPLSPEFYQGADYPYIVQSFHWINRQPGICRRTSYDYTVPDTHEKPLIDTQCPICREKFALYAKAKELGYTKDKGYTGSPPASVELHKAAKALNERIGATSLVSFVENGMLAFPVVLTYGKELMDQIQFHAKRIEDSTGVNICDPQRGYMFDIIIGNKDNSKQRDYRQSLPAMNGGAVDITGNAWKWEEVCHAVKTEIVPIPSPDQVIEFYQTNQAGSNQQSFIHPALKNSNVNVIQPVNNGQIINPVNPGAAVNPGGVVNPGAAVSNPGAVVNNPGNPGTKVAAPVFAPANTNNEVFPCHASMPNGSGYDEQDQNCKGCAQVQTCFDAKNSKAAAVVNPANDQVVNPSQPVNNGVVVNPGKNHQVVNPSQPVKTGAIVNPAGPANPGVPAEQDVVDNVQSRLAVLNTEMQ